MCNPTWALLRGQPVHSNAKKEHPLLVYTLARRLLFDVPSGAHVSIGNSAMITNIPGNRTWSPVDLQGAQALYRGLGLG